ncbi:hypothetical protein P3T20_005092 [Paraburkholderia sp. GAS206C]|uniref:hypothetical protein n=1 Tax=unclassified Paraburkholderia TaxID=2615204 RepID=UPI003D1DD0F9
MLINGFPFAISSLFLKKRIAMAMFQPIDGLDAGGRPLAEGRSRGFPISRTDFSPCRYQDSRRDIDKPMNTGALRRFSQDYDGIVKKVNRLSVAAEHCSGLSIGPSVSLLDLWKVFSASKAIPIIGILRANDMGTVPSPLSLVESSFYKFSLGMLDILSCAFQEGLEAHDVLTGEEMYKLANTRERLIGKKEVCPASSTQIVKVVDQIILQISNSKGIRPTSEIEQEDRSTIEVNYVLWVLQRASVLYEALRCWLFTHQKRSSNKMPKEYKCRYTIAHFQIAIEAGQQISPFEYRGLRSLLRPDWALKEKGKIYTSYCEFTEMYSIIQSRLNEFLQNQEILQEMWASISVCIFELFSAGDVKLKEILGLQAHPHVYVQKDVEVFFGESPA